MALVKALYVSAYLDEMATNNRVMGPLAGLVPRMTRLQSANLHSVNSYNTFCTAVSSCRSIEHLYLGDVGERMLIMLSSLKSQLSTLSLEMSIDEDTYNFAYDPSEYLGHSVQTLESLSVERFIIRLPNPSAPAFPLMKSFTAWESQPTSLPTLRACMHFFPNLERLFLCSTSAWATPESVRTSCESNRTANLQARQNSCGWREFREVRGYPEDLYTIGLSCKTEYMQMPIVHIESTRYLADIFSSIVPRTLILALDSRHQRRYLHDAFEALRPPATSAALQNLWLVIGAPLYDDAQSIRHDLTTIAQEVTNLSLRSLAIELYPATPIFPRDKPGTLEEYFGDFTYERMVDFVKTLAPSLESVFVIGCRRDVYPEFEDPECELLWAPRKWPPGSFPGPRPSSWPTQGPDCEECSV
ncbi:hypothetical protein C8Q79DRAFT_1005890 [Trametes meyenii]|nr:hypothetical protein C8Q79DRAFT_1005890 [Trametes meyenii]